MDQWLWHARFFKTRSLAARVVVAGHVRIDRVVADRPGRMVRVGDVLTFPQGRSVRVVRVLGLARRRGPAVEAQALYDEIAEPGP